MAFSAKLELRQGQQLVMTPQLQQAIRLLQLSNLELAEFVDSELERNPLLEREDAQASAKPEEAIPERDETRGAESSDERWLDLREPVRDHTGGLDADFGNVFQEPGTGEPTASTVASGLSWANVTQRMHNVADDEGDIE